MVCIYIGRAYLVADVSIGPLRNRGRLQRTFVCTYFLTITLVLWAYRLGEHAAVAAALARTFSILLIAACALLFDRVRQSVLNFPSHINSVEAYNFSRKWPGEVFFPWYPLSVYLAEGHVYNFELGVWDRKLTGNTSE